VRKAGLLCQNAMAARCAGEARREGIRAARRRGRRHPGGGGDIDFLHHRSTPMADRPWLFGNPRPRRVLAKGDIVNMELAAGYAAIRRRSARPSASRAEPRWCALLGGHHAARLTLGATSPRCGRGKPMEDMRLASKLSRRACSRRPTNATASISVTDNRHVLLGLPGPASRR